MSFKIWCFLAAMPMVVAACSSKAERDGEKIVHNVFVVSPSPVGPSSVTTLPATVEEGRTISVGFKTGGQIERIYVKEGAMVKQGQLLAVIDAKDYELGVSTLREKLSNLKAETARQTKLHASGNMSDNDYEKAVSGLRQLELQLEIEENRLSYTKLYAPASGVITKVNFENSEMVDAGTPVMELMDNNDMEAIVDLPLRLYSQRSHFSSFIGESSTMPGKEFKLKMLSLTPKANNSQLYRLRLSIPSDVGFTPGMTIKVKIICEGITDNADVAIPVTSIFEENGRRCVWTVNPKDSIIRATTIKTRGTGEDGWIEVTEGLNNNDIIVRAGVRHLTEGEKVNIISTESETNPGNLI